MIQMEINRASLSSVDHHLYISSIESKEKREARSEKRGEEEECSLLFLLTKA